MATDAQADAQTEVQVNSQWGVVQDLTSSWGPNWAQNFDALSTSITQGVQ